MLKKLYQQYGKRKVASMCGIALAVGAIVLLGFLTYFYTDFVNFFNPPQVTTNVGSPAILGFPTTPGEVGSYKFLVLIGLAAIILLAWTTVLLIKSRRDQSSIHETHIALSTEIEKGNKANQALAETQTKLVSASGQLGSLLAGTSDMIAAVDREYRYISFNESYRKVISEMLGEEIEVGDNALGPQKDFDDMRKQSLELWDRALEGEKFSANQVINGNNGAILYFDLTYHPIKNDNDEIIGACQITRDVTERIETSKILKQERDFISAAFDVSSSLVFVLDREGRIVRFNSACEEVSGFSADEVKGRVLWNILLPSEEVGYTKAFFRKIGTEFDRGPEILSRWMTKDEKSKVISWRASCIKDESDGIEYIVATGIDVTIKNEAEQARNRMLAILDNSEDYIGISDVHGQLFYLNRAWRLLLGLTPESDLSKIRLHTCHPDWAQQIIQTEGIPAAAKTGSWLGNTALKTVSNVEIPTSQMLVGHKDADGKLEFISSVARNRTNEKLLEEELAEARDFAVNSTNLKSAFLANMSHEIRTPMNGIIGIAEILKNTRLNEEQTDYVESIASSGEALLTIINDILDFSKIEAGKLEFEDKIFEIKNVSESVLDLIAHQAFQKEIDLSLLIQKDVPAEIRGDAGRLRQVMMNLVGNAVKFTSHGEVAIRVSCDEDETLRFSVRDTGIGIEESVQEAMFDAFSQAETSISGQFGGTGLGLTISKQLVKMMGGEIGFTSDPGKGSEFYFTIPCNVPTENTKSIYPTLRGNSPERNLVIVNNPTISNLLVYQIKAIGLSADAAASANAGQQMLRAAADLKEHFDTVIVDLDLEDDNGSNLFDKIRGELNLRKTAIILLLNADDRESYEIAKSIGIERFIFKPIKSGSIIKALQGRTSDLQASAAQQRSFDSNNVVGPANSKTHTTPTMKQSNTRILIAEDNIVNQKVILNQVSRLGYTVDLVENGLLAFEALKNNDYSMILMDCSMPIMDGFQATAAIREFEADKDRHTPIVAVTAHAIAGDRERCMSQGMDDYISKPTDQQTLREVIGKWCATDESGISSKSEIADEIDDPTAEIPVDEEVHISKRLNELTEVCGEEVVIECIELFLIDTGDVIQKLHKLYNGNNFPIMAREAHKLKGSASNMGAARLPKLCQEMIQCVEEGRNEAVNTLLTQVSQELGVLLPVYRAYLKKIKSGVESAQLTR